MGAAAAGRQRALRGREQARERKRVAVPTGELSPVQINELGWQTLTGGHIDLFAFLNALANRMRGAPREASWIASLPLVGGQRVANTQ